MKKQEELFNEESRLKTKVSYVELIAVRLIRERYIQVEQPVIRSPHDAYEVMRKEYEEMPCERFDIICLNTKNRVIAISTVSVGSLNASIVHPRELFQRAILANAASIILSHNHPSGDPSPSPEDVSLTKRLVEAGKLLDIPVLDHLVVGDSFVSFKEKGII